MIYRCPIDTCGRLLEAAAGDPVPTCEGAPMKEHDPTQAVIHDVAPAAAAAPDPRAGVDPVLGDAVDEARGLIVEGEAADAADAVAQLIAAGRIDVGQADPLRMALAAEGHA